MPTIREVYLQGLEHLRASGSTEPTIEAEVLLRHALGWDRATLYTRWEAAIEPDLLARYQNLLEIRGTGRPVPYIIGEREFMGLSFHVDERVMIPRPETETLVEYLINSFSTAGTRERGNKGTSQSDKRPTTSDKRQLIIVDVGTGSGCIAVSLAHFLPEARVYATEISAAALEIAAENARRHRVADRVALLEGDLLAPLPRRLVGQIDVVVSNPPYVPASQAEALSREIRDFEPAVAVFAPGEGTGMHARLIDEAFRWLRPGGVLGMEVAAGQADRISGAVIRDGRYGDVRVLSDLKGIPRVVIAYRL